MQILLRQRENKVILGFAMFALAVMLLCSSYYQGLVSLKLAAENGRFTPIAYNTPFPPFGGDFLAEWTAGYIVREGNASRLYDQAYVNEVQHDPAKVGIDFEKNALLLLFYPPAYYLLVTPFSLLPIQLAAMLFCCLMATCLIGAAVLAARTCPDHPRAFAWMVFVSFLFFPMIHSLNTGQKGTLWLLIFTAVFVLLHSKRPFTAGLIFGLLALKPPLALVLGLAMLVKGQWRFLGGCAITVLGVVALSFAFGPDAFMSFVDTATHAPDFTLRPDYPLETEHTFYGFFAMLLRGHATPWVIKALAGLMALTTLVFLWRLFRGPLEIGSEKFNLQFAGIILATVLASPKLLTYDLTILLLPIFLFARVIALRPAWVEVHRTKLILAAIGVFIVSSSSPWIAQATHFHLDTVVFLGVLFYLGQIARDSTSVIQPIAPVAVDRDQIAETALHSLEELPA
jgi:hypothetical protein